VKEVEYLGHIVSHEGVKVDPNKIKAMMDWPIPKTLNNIKGFLSLIGYYRKFVRHYGRIETPLTKLTKKDAFSWTQEATKAFEQLKEVMCKAPILTKYTHFCALSHPFKASTVPHHSWRQFKSYMETQILL
jgi:hypothetical protein